MVETTLGQIRFGQSDFAGAAANFQDALAIHRHLAAAAPDDTGAESDVIVLLDDLGDTLAAEKDTGGAVKAYQEALGLARQAAAAQLGAIGAVRAVAVQMAKLAAIPGAGVSWADIVAYIEGAQAKVTLTADDQKWLDIYKSRAAQAAPGAVK